MRTIGILGGMGPAAGADFYARLVNIHRAERDQDHPPCLLFSATQIPDRTEFLLRGGTDPTPDLVAAAQRLEGAGADLIAIPCNSAHAFLVPIRAAVSITVLDMVALAAAAAANETPPAAKVGVLAASGTVSIGLYDTPLASRDREALYPSPSLQADVMAAIKDVKAGGGESSGGSDPRLVGAAARLADDGAQCIILGCTEIPLALAAGDCPVPVIDGNQELAQVTLGLAVGRIEFDGVTHAIR